MNTLTNLIPTIYEALDVVSRELVGFIPAVRRDTDAERAAVNQTILVPATEAQAAQNLTPGVVSPDTGDQTIDNVPVTITNSQFVPVRWNGEQQRGFKQTGTYAQTLRQQFEQAFRTMSNAVESSLATVAYQNASRAYGTAGTTPFGTAGDLSDVAFTRQILDDNGAPQSDLHFVLNSKSTANLRGKQNLLLKMNESGSNALLRRGSISDLPIEGFDMHMSAQLTAVAAGTGSGYVTSGSTAAGVTNVVLATGTGTINAGNIVTFAADSANKYVVNTGIAAPGTLVIGKPGINPAQNVTIPSGNAVTVGATYTPNVAFNRNAIVLVTRAPATPMDENGRPADLAEDAITVTDPVSGIAFEIAMYRQFMQVQYQVRLAWGVAAIKQAHIALLLS